MCVFGVHLRAKVVVLPAVICVIFSSQLVACGLGTVHVTVQSLTDVTYPPKPGGYQIDEWPSEPSRPYQKIARLIATTETSDEDTVREKLKEKARTLGADAVVIKKVDMFEHQGAIHYQSTRSPELSYSIFGGGWGNGFPMFFDPWTYEQTSADGTSWTLYMELVAIRYG